jgi:hypothetical protein
MTAPTIAREESGMRASSRPLDELKPSRRSFLGASGGALAAAGGLILGSAGGAAAAEGEFAALSADAVPFHVEVGGPTPVYVKFACIVGAHEVERGIRVHLIGRVGTGDVRLGTFHTEDTGLARAGEEYTGVALFHLHNHHGHVAGPLDNTGHHFAQLALEFPDGTVLNCGSATALRPSGAGGFIRRPLVEPQDAGDWPRYLPQFCTWRHPFLLLWDVSHTVQIGNFVREGRAVVLDTGPVFTNFHPKRLVSVKMLQDPSTERFWADSTFGAAFPPTSLSTGTSRSAAKQEELQQVFGNGTHTLDIVFAVFETESGWNPLAWKCGSVTVTLPIR